MGLADVAVAGLAPIVTGPRWVTEEHGFESLLLFVRPDSAWAEGVTLRWTRLPDGFDDEILVPGGTGAPATFRLWWRLRRRARDQ